jgi:hypothetical protein
MVTVDVREEDATVRELLRLAEKLGRKTEGAGPHTTR